MASAQVILVRLHAAGPRGDTGLLPRAQLDREGREDRLRELVLHREDVGELPVVAVGPDLPVAGSVDELRRDAQVRPGPADAAV